MTVTHSAEACSRFVARFSDAWASGSAEELLALLDPAVRLRQPLLAPIDGLDAARVSFGALRRSFPGIRAEVHGWVPCAGGVFIEFDLVVPTARPLRWRLIDRFELTSDRVTRRVSYFEFASLASGFVRQPRFALAAYRSGARPRGAKVSGPFGPDAPTICSGRRDQLEIAEFVRRSPTGRTLVRGAISRLIDRPRSQRTFFASPLLAAPFIGVFAP